MHAKPLPLFVRFVVKQNASKSVKFHKRPAMKRKIEDSRWVYVVVQQSGENPQLLGQSDPNSPVPFIPAFLKKSAATKSLPLLAKAVDKTYEIEAMRLDAVTEYAGSNGFAVFVLEEDGRVIERLDPPAQGPYLG